jgi:hypothetical protein
MNRITLEVHFLSGQQIWVWKSIPTDLKTCGTLGLLTTSLHKYYESKLPLYSPPAVIIITININIKYCLINEQEYFIRFKATSAQREWL